MEVKEIPISKIVGSLCRIRLKKDYEREELLASIEECGVMEPIKVKKVKGGYKNFTGNRRIDCSKELGLETIRAEVWDDISDAEAVLMGFVENINRKDFTMLEEGHAYRKLVEEYGHSAESLIKSCGKRTIRAKMRPHTTRPHTTPHKWCGWRCCRRGQGVIEFLKSWVEFSHPYVILYWRKNL